MDAFSEIGPLRSFFIAEVGYLLGIDAEQNDPFMHDFVVFDVVKKRGRYAVLLAGHEDGRSRDAMDLLRRELPDEHIAADGAFGHARAENAATGEPGGHDRERGQSDSNREPSSVGDLDDNRAEE